MSQEIKAEILPVQDHCVKSNKMINQELKEHLELRGENVTPSLFCDPKEIMKNLCYKPDALIWRNFQQEQPNPDRWIILWCNLGCISPNLILTYRDATGNYDLPHPTKAYPVQAWAYIDIPKVDEDHLEELKKELYEKVQKNSK